LRLHLHISLKTNKHKATPSSSPASSRQAVAPQPPHQYVHPLNYPNYPNYTNYPDYPDYPNTTLPLTQSSQITAAIIALLNDARLLANKPALGFLNPWIYSSGYKGFTDITAGQSDGCNGMNTQTGAGVNGVSHALSVTLWLQYG
jgi:hypothetical protein